MSVRLALALLLVVSASGCPTAVECRRSCESAGLVVSHWERDGDCDCADENAPAFTEVHTHRQTTVHHSR